jgi:hypothetical protein
MKLRRALMVVLLLVVCRGANAHFTWLSTDDQQRVVLFFGETPTERNYKLPEAIAAAQVKVTDLEGKSSDVETTKADEKDFIGLRSEPKQAQSGIVTTKVEYGNYHGTLLTYFAKHYVDDDPQAWESESLKSPLKLDACAKRTDEGIELVVTWEGKPLEGAEVTLIAPTGQQTARTTGSDGAARFKDLAEGEAGFLVNHSVEAEGEAGGRPYTTASNFLSVTLRLPAADKPAPAVVDSPYGKLPAPIASFGAAVAGEYLYVYSGHTGEQHVHSKENLSTHFCRVKLAGGEWEALPMETPLQGVPLVAHGDKVYRVGGLDARNATGEDDEDLHSVAEFAMFDPAEKQWVKLPSLPEGRSSHDAVVIGDWLYVVGGWTLSGSSPGAWLDTAWKIDLADTAAGWKPVPNPPFKRRALAVAEWNGHLVAMGGMDEEGKVSQRVDALDLGTSEWKELPPLPGKGISGFGLSAFNIGGQLRVSGMSGILYALSDDGSEWIEGAKMVDPRFFHRLVPGPEGTALVVAGASTERGHVADIEPVPLKIPSSAAN